MAGVFGLRPRHLPYSAAGQSVNCIRGNVIDAVSGLPVDSAWISAYYIDGRHSQTYADTEGFFIHCIGGVTPFDTTFYCGREGYMVSDTSIHLNPGYGKIYEIDFILTPE